MLLLYASLIVGRVVRGIELLSGVLKLDIVISRSALKPLKRRDWKIVTKVCGLWKEMKDG